MADISDVEQACVASIAALLYPAGTSQASIIGATCRIYRGWPSSATLNSDLATGIANVTVNADNEPGQITTRYLPKWSYILRPPTLTARVADGTIRLGGTPAVGTVIGALVDERAYAYRVREGDTLSLVAANLCTAMQTKLVAVAHGSSIYLSGVASVLVRVVCDSNASCEGRRQEKDVRAVCWCPTAALRDSLAAAIDIAFSQTSFLALPDNTLARVTYRNSTTSDHSQNALLYRRDLIYRIEYPTITSIGLPSMLFGAVGLDGVISYG